MSEQKDLTPEELAELKRLEAAATRGPWKAEYTIGEWIMRGPRNVGINGYLGGFIQGPKSEATAELIAANRNALPRLIAMVERLQRSWRCFHCDIVFADEEEARKHFGSWSSNATTEDPECVKFYKQWGSNALAARYEKQQAELATLRSQISENDAISDVIVAGADREITELRSQLAEKDVEIERKNAEITTLVQQLGHTERELEEAQCEK